MSAPRRLTLVDLAGEAPAAPPVEPEFSDGDGGDGDDDDFYLSADFLDDLIEQMREVYVYAVATTAAVGVLAILVLLFVSVS